MLPLGRIKLLDWWHQLFVSSCLWKTI